jgi:hypothetical protein
MAGKRRESCLCEGHAASRKLANILILREPQKEKAPLRIQERCRWWSLGRSNLKNKPKNGIVTLGSRRSATRIT